MGQNSKLPQLLTDFRIYGEDGATLIGNAELTLPDIEYMTETIKVSGVAGEIDMPIIGMIGSMSTEIKWTTINEQSMALAAPKASLITARGNQQIYNTDTGRSDNQSVTVTMKIMSKKFSLGKFEKAASTDSGNEFEVLMIKVLLEGVEWVLIDKINYIFRIGGVDYLEQVRANMGLDTVSAVSGVVGTAFA